ncbi:bifunctional hydroxymethylpyrimidine kinase/phosphomethylpyrimidine kinase [uncultured Tyzzerella sp.]|uniref:bifunctional hydroxymethylpyrimidine kinase/phosphomethylpyrimidine kinase n=1 Tax=uncultured Tyzzerella sp. TaxID=2321398 RepID=UPI002942588A|nr:bifunctional hydroxymethylpyrimidine kinase/phosphomethylpyrimidine kinase [uncultured Tyzzerella sp.]
MKVSLTIAGSDSSGGAGIQADIKTMTTNGVYAMSAITALTAQNTQGVYDILNVTEDFMKIQLDTVFNDIYPDSVKVGMVSSQEILNVIVEKLKEYNAKNIVVDPVMISTSGCKLISDNAISFLKENLFPLARIITPNIPEAELLTGIKIKNKDDMIDASKNLYDKYKCAVLCKGGHSTENSDDLLYNNGVMWFYGEKIDNKNTHGTGCSLSSAIAANLAKGQMLDEAVKNAKDYISGALRCMLNLGKGTGPINHLFNLNFKD